MAAEWLAPVGTIVAASITAGFGGWIGGRRSRKDQDAQHRFERETALTEQGREKARDAITALRYLQRHRRAVVEWSGVAPEGDLDLVHEQHERLGQAIEYFHDESVRHQIELVYDALDSSYVVTTYGDSDVGEPGVMIWRACQEGRAVLGRYLRGEPTQEPSTYMTALRLAYDSGHEEIERQHDEWQQSQRGQTPESD